jgi:hypothetical protein
MMPIMDREEQDLTYRPPKGSLREKDNLYYEILAGGARMRFVMCYGVIFPDKYNSLSSFPLSLSLFVDYWKHFLILAFLSCLDAILVSL